MVAIDVRSRKDLGILKVGIQGTNPVKVFPQNTESSFLEREDSLKLRYRGRTDKSR
jgi:hypothetical protein